MTRSHDTISLLKAARPDDLDDVDQATRNRVLHKAYMAVGSSPAPCKTRVRRPRPTALGAGAVAVAGATAWAMIAGPVAGRGQYRPSTTQARGESATAVLLTAATDVQTARTPTAGRYWHTSIRTGPLSPARPPARPPARRPAVAPAAGLVPLRLALPLAAGQHRCLRMQWMQIDRWVASSPSDATWFADTTSAACRSVPYMADPRDSGQRSFDVEGRALTMTQLAKLPTAPAALRAFLLAPYPVGYQRSRPVQLVQRLFGEAADLTMAPVDPAVRAAVYRLLASLPGIEALGAVGDAVGRHGTAIAISDGDVLHELIIDPRTGAVLDMQDVTRVHGHTAIVSYNAILAAGWTTALPFTPQAPRR